MIVIWECYLWEFVREHALGDDANMKRLWQGFEAFLQGQFPEATRMATPFNDPIAKTMDEYHTFLRSLGYEPIAHAVFGKAL